MRVGWGEICELCNMTHFLRLSICCSIINCFVFIADENRDINGHPEDDLKRQRSQYNGDQLYSNVSEICSQNLCAQSKILLSSFGRVSGASRKSTNSYRNSERRVEPLVRQLTTTDTGDSPVLVP